MAIIDEATGEPVHGWTELAEELNRMHKSSLTSRQVQYHWENHLDPTRRKVTKDVKRLKPVPTTGPVYASDPTIQTYAKVLGTCASHDNVKPAPSPSAGSMSARPSAQAPAPASSAFHSVAPIYGPTASPPPEVTAPSEDVIRGMREFLQAFDGRKAATVTAAKVASRTADEADLLRASRMAVPDADILTEDLLVMKQEPRSPARQPVQQEDPPVQQEDPPVQQADPPVQQADPPVRRTPRPANPAPTPADVILSSQEDDMASLPAPPARPPVLSLPEYATDTPSLLTYFGPELEELRTALKDALRLSKSTSQVHEVAVSPLPSTRTCFCCACVPLTLNPNPNPNPNLP
jgi:hypothetical protein